MSTYSVLSVWLVLETTIWSFNSGKKNNASAHTHKLRINQMKINGFNANTHINARTHLGRATAAIEHGKWWQSDVVSCAQIHFSSQNWRKHFTPSKRDLCYDRCLPQKKKVNGRDPVILIFVHLKCADNNFVRLGRTNGWKAEKNPSIQLNCKMKQLKVAKIKFTIAHTVLRIFVVLIIDQLIRCKLWKIKHKTSREKLAKQEMDRSNKFSMD